MTINGGAQVTTAERAEMLNYGTNDCAYCGEEFTADNPCYNDEATYENGSHKEGECKNCTEKREARNPRFRPTPQHERGE